MATRQHASPPRRIPGIREWPLLGSAPAMRRDPLAVHLRVARECGEIGSFHLGPLRVVLLNSPDLIRQFQVERAGDYDKGDFVRRAFVPMAPRGLLISEGALHRTQRRLLAPLFQPRRVAGYGDTMTALTDRAQGSWAEGQRLDLVLTMRHLTMEIVTAVLFSAAVPGAAAGLGRAVEAVLRWMSHTLTHPFPAPLWFPVPRSRRARRARTALRQHTDRLIAERRARGDDRGDLLSALLLARDEDGRALGDEEVRDQVLTAFIAGHETTANALAWTFALLVRHPACYDRLEREVDRTLAGRLPAVADLSRLPYTLQVFKEAMRLYPPAAVVARVAVRDSELGGYPIAKGTMVLYSQFALHRRPDLFPDPERFDPERFSPAREPLLPRHAYLPFGSGHRTCIGNHFALMEAQLVLAALAGRVRFEPVGTAPVVPKFVVTLLPRGGVTVRVRRRDRPPA